MEKLFVEVWGGNYAPSKDGSIPHETDRVVEDYHTGVGYTETDIKSVNSLEVGEQYGVEHGLDHIIIRIR